MENPTPYNTTDRSEDRATYTGGSREYFNRVWWNNSVVSSRLLSNLYTFAGKYEAEKETVSGLRCAW